MILSYSFPQSEAFLLLVELLNRLAQLRSSLMVEKLCRPGRVSRLNEWCSNSQTSICVVTAVTPLTLNAVDVRGAQCMLGIHSFFSIANGKHTFGTRQRNGGRLGLNDTGFVWSLSCPDLRRSMLCESGAHGNNLLGDFHAMVSREQRDKNMNSVKERSLV